MQDRDPWEPIERLPVFVYGTLRPGRHNDVLWSWGATDVADGVAKAFGIKLTHNGSIPFARATDDPTDFTVGALIVTTPETWRYIIHSLDQLEGHPHLYERTRLKIDVDGEPVDAWVYLVGPDFPAHPEVPGGDWAKFDDEQRLRRAGFLRGRAFPLSDYEGDFS